MLEIEDTIDSQLSTSDPFEYEDSSNNIVPAIYELT